MLVIRLLFDFGLLILIWLVQLVIYPGFKYYPLSDLAVWHKIYTRRIALVVAPLMLGQLVVAGYQLWEEHNSYTIGSFLIIVSLWLLTFRIFIPLHNLITNQTSTHRTTIDLAKKNWWRTILWTGLFFWTLITYSASS